MSLQAVKEGATPPEGSTPSYDIELAPRDEAIFFLLLGAEVEHALMVQYLYAGYSIDPMAAPAEQRTTVQKWQSGILAIAREEMGHLITVQNLLRCIGGPLSLAREEFPIDTGYYPFSFVLEPLSLDSLAKYVVAEMPLNPNVPKKEMDEIKKRASKGNAGVAVNRVGALYKRALDLVKTIDSGDFQSGTLGYQGDFAAWGRGNTRAPRDGMRSGPSEPQVIVDPIGDITAAIHALEEVSEQGEGQELCPREEESHFMRFLTIYRAFRKAPKGIVKKVPVNPTTRPGQKSSITNATSILWAQLADTRYRLLLDLLSHALHLPGSLTAEAAPSPRGRLIAGAFGEMYNIRALSGIIMAQPLTYPETEDRAGPPFEMPYTLQLPDLEPSRWRAHRDVLTAAGTLITGLLKREGLSPDSVNYLNTLAAQDATFQSYIAQLLAPAIAQGL
jgi:hypothetical protein